MSLPAADLPIDTSSSAWNPHMPYIDLTNWVRAAASNYLCELAGVDPMLQSNYQDRPYGVYDSINSTDDRIVQAWNTGLPLNFDDGLVHSLQTAYADVQNARGTLTRTTA